MLGQSDDVLGTLPQRRYAKLKLAETMKKVLAKAARVDGGVEILIGGGNDADVDRDLAVASQAVEGRSIQHAQ